MEEFTISPQRAEAAATQTRRLKTRERSAVLKLVSSSALADGTQLFLRTTTEIDAEARTLVDNWVDEDPRRGRASWQNDKAKPLTWEYDGGSYRPTSIVSQILQGAAHIDRSVRGTSWWVTEDGMSLVDLAGKL